MSGDCCSAQSTHKPVQQSRQQTLRAYCPDMYTVPNMAIKGDDKDPTLAPADAVPENMYKLTKKVEWQKNHNRQ